MNLSAFSTLFFLVFSTPFFPKRAAKIGGMNLSFQIFLLKNNVGFLKAAPEADFRLKIFLYNYAIRQNIPLKSTYLAI
jgi:hypothetical protein